jgi:hypothetical protein
MNLEDKLFRRKTIFEDDVRKIEKIHWGDGLDKKRQQEDRCDRRWCKRDPVYYVTLKQDLPGLLLHTCKKHSRTITIDNVKDVKGVANVAKAVGNIGTEKEKIGT